MSCNRTKDLGLFFGADTVEVLGQLRGLMGGCGVIDLR